MICAEAAPLLAAHVDGALGAVARASVAAHAESCTACGAGAQTARDALGRLEAQLAGYRASERDAAAVVETALAGFGAITPWHERAGPWLVLALGGGACVPIPVALTASRLSGERWFYEPSLSGIGETAFALCGLGTALGAVLLAAAAWWRTLREVRPGAPESIAVGGLVAGAAACLAWPVVGAMLARLVGSNFPGPGADAAEWTGPVAHALGSTAVLGLAVLVVLPFITKPAASPDALARRDQRPSGARVLAWLRDATRAMGLAAFERGAGLLDAARAAEEALPLLARHFAEAWRGGLGPVQLAQSLAAGEVALPAPGHDAPGLAVRKVAARRALEAALRGLAPGPRAVAYLRLAAGLPLGEVARLTGRLPDEVCVDLGGAVAALGALAPANAQNA